MSGRQGTDDWTKRSEHRGTGMRGRQRLQGGNANNARKLNAIPSTRLLAGRAAWAGLLACMVALAVPAGHAEAQGDAIRKLVLIAGAQAADPQEFQAAQL